MTDFQFEKQLVREYYAALDAAQGDDITGVLSRYTGADCLWRGVHPFHEQTGGKAVSEIFWQPFRLAFHRMQRRLDIFMAGRNEIDGFQSVWVTSMGHLMGLFDSDWLGIRPTRKLVFQRYCEFNRIEDGKISETAMFFDIPHVMLQAGINPFPPQTAAHLVQPGPMTHDGLMFEPQHLIDTIPGFGETE